MKEETNYQMPKRNRSDQSFKNFNSKQFTSNYFQMTILPDKNDKNDKNKKITMIYEYQCQITQSGVEIQKGSRLYHTTIKAFQKDLIASVGYQMHHGQIVFGTKNEPNRISFSLQNQLKVKDLLQNTGKDQLCQKNQKLQIVFTKVKETNLNGLSIQNSPDVNAHILQILNINLKNKAKAAKLVQLGRTGKYYYNEVDQIYNADNRPQLLVSRGFKFNIVPLNRGFSLLIDVCFRVMQHKLFSTVLGEQKKQLSKQQINQKYKGKSVTTKYGNYKNYQILEIDFSMSPASKFIQGNGKEITYIDYYLNHHHRKIQSLDQPMVKVLLRTQKIKSGNEIKKKEYYGYLVPQLISLAGVNDTQSAQFSIMKNLSNITKLQPTKRLEYCKKIKQAFNESNDFLKIGEPISLQGFTLNKPELNYGAQKQLLQSATFEKQKYFFVYSQGKNPKLSDSQADSVVDCLKQASRRYNVKFQDPAFINVSNTQYVEDWISQIDEDVKKNGKPKIIIYLLKQKQTSFYKKLKSYSINTLSCPSQCIRWKNFDKTKNKMSYASKLTIQMSTKVGCVPWIVKMSHQYFNKINVMHCGIATSKGKYGNYLSFVGTIKNSSSNYFSTCKKLSNNPQQNKKNLETIFLKWAKTYFVSNDRKAPNLILIYRQGLNQVQAKKQIIDFEIPAMQTTIANLMKCTPTKVQPEYMIINVNKKINSRFFKNNKNQIRNPDSGSVVIEEMNNSTSFELAAQNVTQGTCTPTKFTILHDKSTLKNEALISYTHDMCYQYYNWQGPVRVPAVEQYASKLALFCSGGIEEEIKQVKQQKGSKEVQLTQTLFYL